MAKIVQVARYTADGTQVVREFEKMGQAGEKTSQRVRQGAAGMSSSLRAVDASAGVAREKMEGLAGSAGSVGTVLRSLGPVGLVAAAGIGAAALALKALHDGARNAVRELGAIDIAAQRVGVSTDTLQEVRFAILGIGGAAEQADSALSQFAEKLGEARLTGGGGGFNALRQLGFDEATILNMDDIEASLPRIADAIGRLGDASKQNRIARELGLEALLPLLQQGEGAFDRAAEAAQRMGYVLDRDLLARSRELSGEWEQASQIIELQLKVALVELADEFVSVAQAIADAAVAMNDFIDSFKELEDRTTSSLRRRAGAIGGEQFRLVGEFGEGVTRDDPNRDARDGALLSSQNRLAHARAVFAALERERLAIQSLLTERGPDAARSRPAGTSPTAPGAGAASEHQRFVEQLREELRVREALLDIQDDFPKASQEEAQARFELAEQLARLAEARAAGAIASDADLAALEKAVQANYDAAAAASAFAEAMEARNAQAEQWRGLMISLETPRERLLREEADFRKLWGGREGTETFARGIAQIREEYEALAEAQFEASIAGRTLAGVLDGQIRSFGDLGRVLQDMLADAAVRELLSGSLFRGGFGGFATGLGDRVADSITGGDQGFAGLSGLFGDGEEDAAAALAKSAKAAASALDEGLIPSVADAAVKVLAGTVATVAETGAKGAAGAVTAAETLAKGASTKSLVVLTLAADAAAKALAAIAAQQQTEDLVNAFAAFSGGGMAGGGSMLVGARHGVAEGGAEIAVVGGWGQVVPHDALAGLALLAKLSHQAAAPARAPSGSPRVTVNLRNESGVDMEATADASMAADGGIDVELVLGKALTGQIGRGRADDALRGRFDLRPRRVRRG